VAVGTGNGLPVVRRNLNAYMRQLIGGHKRQGLLVAGCPPDPVAAFRAGPPRHGRRARARM